MGFCFGTVTKRILAIQHHLSFFGPSKILFYQLMTDTSCKLSHPSQTVNDPNTRSIDTTCLPYMLPNCMHFDKCDKHAYHTCCPTACSLMSVTRHKIPALNVKPTSLTPRTAYSKKSVTCYEMHCEQQLMYSN